MSHTRIHYPRLAVPKGMSLYICYIPLARASFLSFFYMFSSIVLRFSAAAAELWAQGSGAQLLSASSYGQFTAGKEFRSHNDNRILVAQQGLDSSNHPRHT